MKNKGKQTNSLKKEDSLKIELVKENSSGALLKPDVDMKPEDKDSEKRLEPANPEIQHVNKPDGESFIKWS